MELVLLANLFSIGCFLGSFFLVLIDRLPRSEKLTGRSHCENCNHVLTWYDLIPVFSFLSTGGKCRYCKAKLSYYYPFIELLTGGIFAILYVLTYQLPLFQIIYYYVIVSMLLVLFFADIRYTLLPFPIIAVLFLATIVFRIIDGNNIFPALLSGLGAAGFFLSIFLISKGKGIGFGDVVYSLWMGFALGFPGIIFGLYVAFLTGAVISLILILLGLKKLRGDTIPFGPFLILGTILVLFWQDQLLAIARLFLPI